MNTLLKIILFITIVFCNTSTLMSQSVVWRQIIGEQYNEVGRDVIELSDHGYLMVGEKKVLAKGNPYLGKLAYLVKLNKIGNIEWEKVLGDSANINYCMAVSEDPYGNIYVPYGANSQQHLVKMNSSGIILWEKKYSSNILFFAGITFVDEYKNLMLVGQNEVSTIYTSSLTKLDSGGNLIWNKAYYDTIPSLYAYSSYSNCYLFTENFYLLCGNRGIDGFVIKTDTSGNRIWTKTFTQSQYIMSIQKNSENTFIATGLGQNFGTYCLKFDGNGDTIWTKNFGLDSANYYGYSKIVRTYSGNFVIGTALGTRIGIMDSLGNINAVYRNSYPSNIEVAQWNVNSTSDSGLVLTGYYAIFSKGRNNNTLITDAIIFKVDKYGNMVSIKNYNEIISENFEINTFPNPFNLSFKLSFNLTGTSKVKVELFDLSGKKVREIENKSLSIGNHQYLINTPELSSGIYFIRLTINSKVYSRKILLIK